MMKISVSPDAARLGREAARETAQILRQAILERGHARVILSTGMSQFTTLEALVKEKDIDWSRVEMFHLDEYVALPITHKASFRKYLQERFVEPTGVGTVHFVDGTPECIEALTKELNAGPIDVGLIGIGQNTHIAFNDPPADFTEEAAYIIVNLDDVCKGQQVQEGWFPTRDDVPKQAVSMSVRQIMKCDRIISAVPYAEKADAVAKTLSSELTPEVPASMLKTHPHFSLYVDKDSFAKTDLRAMRPASGQKDVTVTFLYEGDD